jgi:hypothetical protein
LTFLVTQVSMYCPPAWRFNPLWQLPRSLHTICFGVEVCLSYVFPVVLWNCPPTIHRTHRQIRKWSRHP